MRYDFLQDIKAGHKVWEGRLLSSLLKITRGAFPCPRCSVCLFTGQLGTVRRGISRVVVCMDLSIITADNYATFVPSAASYMCARALYAAMGPGPYVFLRLT